MLHKETSRERVLKTMNHQEPDSLAIDFGSSTSTGISVFAYQKLQQHLGVDKDKLPKLYELFLMMADPSLSMIDRMGGDIIQLKRYAPHFGIALEDWKEWVLPYGSKCLVPGGFNPKITEQGLEILDSKGKQVAAMPTGSYYFEQTVYPYEGIEEIDQVDALNLKGMSENELSYLVNEAKRLHDESDKAVMFPIYGRIFEAGMQGWGFEEWLVQLMTNKTMVHHYMEKLAELHIQDLTKVLDSCNEYIDIIRFVDDLGTQTSQIMSLNMYREMIKPYHKRMFEFVKSRYPKQKIALHCCGAIKPFIPDLIDIGVEVLNPVQISASEMDPTTLKREFGKDLTFWGGGADMQFEAISGNLTQLGDHVKKMIDIFGSGGGFIFAPTHNIQADISAEIIMAIYNQANSYR